MMETVLKLYWTIAQISVLLMQHGAAAHVSFGYPQHWEESTSYMPAVAFQPIIFLRFTALHKIVMNLKCWIYIAI